MLIAGDLNADRAVVPCLSKGISAGRFLDLALAYSRGLVLPLTLLVGSVGRKALVRVGFLCRLSQMLLLLQMLVMLLIGGSRLIFLYSLAFVLMLGWLMLLARMYVSLSGLHVWLDTPDRSSSSSTRVVQDVWNVCRDELGLVPEEVVLALRNAVSRSSVDDFWTIWSRSAQAGLFRTYSRAGGPTEAGSAAFLGRGLLRIRNRRLGGRAVGSR